MQSLMMGVLNSSKAPTAGVLLKKVVLKGPLSGLRKFLAIISC